MEVSVSDATKSAWMADLAVDDLKHNCPFEVLSIVSTTFIIGSDEITPPPSLKYNFLIW